MTLGKYQFEISANTVRRRLAEHGLRPRIPARGPQLTAAHRRVRLLFTQNHVDWKLDQWRLVMFSDESRFCLDQSDRRVRVNRCSGERYAQRNIIRKSILEEVPLWFEQVSLSTLAQSWWCQKEETKMRRRTLPIFWNLILSYSDHLLG
jgi:hypothetical protein